MALSLTQVLAYLEAEFDLDLTDVNHNTPLFSEGLIDSFGLVSLITFISDETGIEIDDDDLTLENFDTVNRVVAYLDRATA